MATKTLVTASAQTLTAVAFSQSPLVLLPADRATVSQLILNDQNVAHPALVNAFVYEGSLIVPNRGALKLLPGDVVAVDSRGWPILVSADSIANGTTWTFA